MKGKGRAYQKEGEKKKGLEKKKFVVRSGQEVRGSARVFLEEEKVIGITETKRSAAYQGSFSVSGKQGKPRYRLLTREPIEQFTGTRRKGDVGHLTGEGKGSSSESKNAASKMGQRMGRKHHIMFPIHLLIGKKEPAIGKSGLGGQTPSPKKGEHRNRQNMTPLSPRKHGRTKKTGIFRSLRPKPERGVNCKRTG